MIPSEPSPEPGWPPIHCAPRRTSPSASENAGRNHLDLVVCMKDLLDGGLEEARERERQSQRGDVLPGLDRVDRLPRDAQRLRELALREACQRPPVPDVVPHRVKLA